MLNHQTICTCSNRPHEGVYKRQERFDPTKTTSLRRSFVVAMRKRVKTLCIAIIKKVIEGDCFGLNDQQFKITVMSFPGHAGRPGQVGGSLPRGAGAYPNGKVISKTELRAERHFYVPGSEEDSPFQRWLDEGAVEIVRVPVTIIHQPEGHIPEPNKSIQYHLQQWEQGYPVPIVSAHWDADKRKYVISDGGHRTQAYKKHHKYMSLLVTKEKDPQTNQLATHSGEFNFSRSADKVTAFMEWLRQQEKLGLLAIGTANQLGQGVEGSWTDFYIADSYERGVQRARYELIKRGYDVPALDKLAPVSATFSTPFHIDRVGLVFSRVYTELKGITNDMDKQISTILAQGLVDGKNPRDLARMLVRTITGPDGDLGITDTLGRYIPAARRAEMLARTEIIRAHHIATVQEYKNWGLEGVTVMAEWQTAGYNVCPKCSELQGKVFTISQIETMIPAHPNCRCCAIPVDMTDKEKK